MKKGKLRLLRENLARMKFNLVLLAVFIAASVTGLMMIENTLLDNGQRMGTALSQSYSVKEERNMIAYSTLLELSSEYVDAETAGQHTDYYQWIQSFLAGVSNATGNQSVDPYAVVDGEIIAANPWEGDTTYDVTQTMWYQKAVAEPDKVVFTDAYPDAITGKPIITIAKASSATGNIVAFDIFPEYFQVENNSQELPEGSSYFLCDSSGTILYQKSSLNAGKEELQRYVSDLIGDIQDGAFDSSDSYVYDLNGKKRAVYYDIADNGWISIITIPYASLLEDVYNIFWGYLAILVFFLIAAVLMGIREYHLNQNIARTNDTVRVLGNSYYAIYRINLNSYTYEMIKGSDYVRTRIPKIGAYEDLIKVIEEIMEPGAFQEFSQSFSVNNITQLVSQRVKDYGGDFRRLFNGVYRWVNVRMLFDESLSPGEVVLCFREVEEEKQRQLQEIELLSTSLEAARKSEESKNSFFSSMSHDMRTPLNAIIGLSELAESHGEDSQKVKEYLKKINVSSKQLLGLINDILEISRLEQGSLTFEDKQMNLRQCVEECVSVFRSQIDQEQKSFSLNFEMQDEMVYGDSFRINQILNNLLSNAIKFTQPGDEISLAVREIETKEHAKYQFVVTDTGAGMSKGFLDKIFVPYERETRFGAKNVVGTGLGMPIVKNIVSQMGGQIVVDSTLGQGSTFTVTLPFELVQSEALEPSEQQVSEGEQQPDSQSRLKGKKILLAEDNDINMEIATELLQMYGMEVLQAWNGAEAVQKFEASQPYEIQGILMDMQMPEMDGCEASRRIRSMNRPDAKTIPIIAVTANAFAEDLAATTAAGMNAHISKPIEFQLLCETLEKLLP